ncbi:MAG: hypothetical protein O3A00_24805 [Planctomycetota bacterium]|nr:hypothetical protein [Planctomycetota bacterium]
MATTQLPNDFKDFLKLLNEHEVNYLLIGGHAVGYYGYPRPTGDLDIWIEMAPDNASRLVRVFEEFGFRDSGLNADAFLEAKNIIRAGFPPLRIEVLTTVSGVEFTQCYERMTRVDIDGIPVTIISFDDLRTNKRASGRTKDLADLEHLD